VASPGTTGRHGPALSDGAAEPPSPTDPREAEKRAAAIAAAELVQDDMRVGLGTGTTVAHLLPAIAARGLKGLRCVATSPGTEALARELGLPLETLDEIGELDIAIDGADQIAPDGWIIKGGGGAQTREKIVAEAARRFVVIVSSDKPVERLTPPIPLEVLRFGAGRSLELLAPARLREGKVTPDGGLLADYLGPVEDPAALAARFDAVPGMVGHGLFAPEMVSLVLVAGADGEILRRVGAKGAGG
jgi:ribose 5-phosphate isomerase A